MRKAATDIIKEYGCPLRAYDEHGNEVFHVGWVDDEKGEFGQYVTDEDGCKQVDPEHQDRAWMITRIGRLRLEKLE